MIACRTRVFASVFLIPLALTPLHADVTVRYQIETKMNPAMPIGPKAAAPQETVYYLKDGKGFSTAAGYDSITDFTTQEITLLDAANRRFAKLNLSQYGEEIAKNAPKMPAAAMALMASVKVDAAPARVTGRTAVIQGVETEEREIVLSIGGPALPTAPAGPAVKMVLQLWMAKSAEVLRVPAIRELTGYSLWTIATMNPLASMETALKQMPGFSDIFKSLFAEMRKGTMMRMHIDMFMPALVPDAPFMQMNLETVELSSAPVLGSLFQIPDGYQQAAASDLIKDMTAPKH